MRRTEWTTLIIENLVHLQKKNNLLHLLEIIIYIFYGSIPSRPFPSDLNIQGSRFHIGSRGLWKGLFSVRCISLFQTIIRFVKDMPWTRKWLPLLWPHIQGLLRQLVLVPGSDATHQICPSSDPQLATLSVPPLFLDLPATGAEDDRHVNTYGNLHMHVFLLSINKTLHVCLPLWLLSGF